MDNKCWSCEERWELILDNGLCIVCNAYKFTKNNPKSPIVEYGTPVPPGKPEDVIKDLKERENE